MKEKLKLIIFGASGRMGQALLRIAEADPRFELVAGVVGHNVSPMDGVACSLFAINQLAELPEFDIAIDFSQPEAFENILQFCESRTAALVSGTTGLNDSQKQMMSSSAQKIPLLWASNFSLGVAVLNDLVRRAAKALETWGVEITEIHHVHKKDAPSGTALTLGQSAEAVAGKVPVYVSHREGEVIGDHTVKFSGRGEFVELRHNALDRDIFVRGALEAAFRLQNKPAGIYQFADLIFSD
ncbi:MAG: 4-hydroxy-tetrahydrodipicolinate reductase [Arenimonas sp.]